MFTRDILASHDILDAAQCKAAAISLNLVNSNYATAVEMESELDRPHGCRVNPDGNVLIWINTLESSSAIPDGSNIIICEKTMGRC